MKKGWTRLSLQTVILVAAMSLAQGARIPTTPEDFRVPGTQVGNITIGEISTSDNCSGCHGFFDPGRDIYSAWKGSLMSMSAIDPLFYAQLTTANQDASEAGLYCLRCHAPFTVASGHVPPASGALLDEQDRDGVTCHICHGLVDPIFKPGISPPEDLPILAATMSVPAHYGNGAFVLDPTFTMRGPLPEAYTPHGYLQSPIHESANHCGTCHDLGNVSTTRMPDGTYRYNAVGQPADNPDPRGQFPLQSTYTEFRLSAFANGGVDMGSRFPNPDEGVIESCQGCHQPDITGQACYFGPVREDIPLHEFAGGGVSVMELIATQHADDPFFDMEDLRRGQQRSLSMLARASTFAVTQSGGALRVRTINETGHKLPTGHNEGRRIWVSVRFYGGNGALIREYGHYDPSTAHLDEGSTRVYEIRVGLSGDASMATGLPEGPTFHMVLADTILKDNRIPPRGFANHAYEEAGAPVVAHAYMDGQYWDDAWFTIPTGAARAVATLRYQTLPRDYVEELRDDNTTDDRGQVLFALWDQTGRGAPVEMASVDRAIAYFLAGDIDGNCRVDGRDQHLARAALGKTWTQPGFQPRADLDGDHVITTADLSQIKIRTGSFCRASALLDRGVSTLTTDQP